MSSATPESLREAFLESSLGGPVLEQEAHVLLCVTRN